jgi:hypothetical protein
MHTIVSVVVVVVHELISQRGVVTVRVRSASSSHALSQSQPLQVP